jgi:hypothetical protein
MQGVTANRLITDQIPGFVLALGPIGDEMRWASVLARDVYLRYTAALTWSKSNWLG